MKKDPRYKRVKILIMNGSVKTLGEVLFWIPKTVIKKDLKMHYDTFKKLIAHPEKFSLAQTYQLAALFKIDEMKAIDLIHEECQIRKKAKKKQK